MNQKKRGAVTPWSPEVKAEVIKLLNVDVPVKDISAQLGVSESHVYKTKALLLKRSPKKKTVLQATRTIDLPDGRSILGTVPQSAPFPINPPATIAKPRSMLVGSWAIIAVNINGTLDESMRAFLDAVKQVREGTVAHG